MIGQANNKKMVDAMANSFPRFTIITGQKASGKTELALYIANKLRCHIVEVENSIDGIRAVKREAYGTGINTIYLIKNADSLSLGAKNSLLKVTEEPPKQSYFIMTTSRPERLLDTLWSRSFHMGMEPYSKRDLWSYARSLKLPEDKLNTILRYANSPGNLKLLVENDVFDFCNSVIDNIGKVSGVNAFQIANKLDFKGEGEGYDLDCFFHVIAQKCIERFKETGNKLYGQYYMCTEAIIPDLAIKGIKKDATIDMWILNMRDIYKEYGDGIA